MIPDLHSPPYRLRGDLVISRQTENGASGVIIKDPVRGGFFRFREVEGFILDRLVGTGSLESICTEVQNEFGGPLSLSTLEQFVQRLDRLGLLQRDESAGRMPEKPRRVRGSIFYLRLSAFDPDRLLDRLVGKLRFLFTPAFVWFSAVSILAAIALTLANWNEIAMDLPRLYSLQSLALAWFVGLLVVVAHEFAHGLTCKHFGGSVREMGFLLLFFQPAFFCNVSDAWLFPRKAQRLWVTFAGAYFEMFLWALATFIWRLTDPSTVINYIALVVVATSAIKSFFNLNPLIKLDGYYLLSDFVEIPNLRQKAFGFLGACVKRLWGAASKPALQATVRERRIYLLYGVMAWTYSFWLLAFLAIRFGGYLTERLQGWGFVLFAVCLAGLFQSPLKKLLRASISLVRVNAGMNIWVKRGLRLLVLAGVGAALWFCRMELRISGPFTILPMRHGDVRAEVEGIIQEIFAEEGDSVQKGDRIASLVDRDYLAELRKTKAELEEKQARLNLLKAGTRREEIQLATTTAAKAEERIKYARDRLEMDRTLVQNQLISKREFEETRETLALREKEHQEAQDKLTLLQAGSRKEDMEAVAAEISRLNAVQRQLEDQLKLLTVNSPITGIITTHKLKETVGRNVKKGDLIAEVHEVNTVTAEIAIPEKEIGDVKVGQKLILKARAYPQTNFEGTVVSIAPVANTPEDPRAERTVLVTTQLDNASRLLKPEMTGNAKIYCGEQRLLDIVSRRLVRFVRVEFWSWW
jgi:multidrug resistance efflux pump